MIKIIITGKQGEGKTSFVKEAFQNANIVNDANSTYLKEIDIEKDVIVFDGITCKQCANLLRVNQFTFRPPYGKENVTYVPRMMVLITNDNLKIYADANDKSRN